MHARTGIYIHTLRWPVSESLSFLDPVIEEESTCKCIHAHIHTCMPSYLHACVHAWLPGFVLGYPNSSLLEAGPQKSLLFKCYSTVTVTSTVTSTNCCYDYCDYYCCHNSSSTTTTAVAAAIATACYYYYYYYYYYY